jgi:YggT family protein
MNGSLLGLLNQILQIYFYILVAHAMISWLPSLRNSSIAHFLYAMTAPYVSLFRFGRFSRIGQLDISFLWAMLFLQFLQGIVAGALRGRAITLFSLLQSIFSMVHGLGNTLIILFIILTGVRLIFYKSASPRAAQANYMLDSILGGMVSWWRNIISKNKFIAHQTLLFHLLLLLGAAYLFWMVVVYRLLDMVLKLLAS